VIDPEPGCVIDAQISEKTQIQVRLGHWWMLENPELAAGALDRFWAAPSGRPTTPPA
jgi:hypothetical protein